VSSPPTLFVSYSGALGGSERILLDLVSGLEPPVSVACPEGPLAERLRAAAIPVLPLRERSLEMRHSLADRLATPLRLSAQALEVRAHVVGSGAAVLVASGTRGLLVCASALAGLRPRPPLVFQQNELLPGVAIARLVRALLTRVERVVTLSETIARDLDPARTLGNRLAVIRPGVDLARFAPRATGAGTATPHALWLGALVRWKRPDLALEAAALAARALPALRLTLAGPVIDAHGRELLLPALRRRSQRPDLAGRVELPGALTDGQGALAEASCLLHTADCEPYGMVMAEALACGLPVVAPAACGALEIVDESCARLFTPGDAPGAARALVKVLGEPSRLARMAGAARGHAEHAHDLERSRREYAKLLAEVRRR